MHLRPIGKKGDLSLSINAIVILILAITVMGLGLTFIRGLFKSATEKLGGALEATELQNPPTSEKPLTIDQRITLSLNEKKAVQIGIYNPSTSSTPAKVKPSVKECVGSAGGAPITGTDLASKFILATPEQEIESRGIKGYSAILTVKGVAPDTYICTINVVGTATVPTELSTVSASTFIEVK